MFTLDVGLGRRMRPLGPVAWTIPAPRERVFDLLAAPYAERQPRAFRDKVDVWERSAEMVLAAHHTQVGRRTFTTVETVRFIRPERIDFRLVRGPVPHVSESFLLEDRGESTELTWRGELGADFGPLGEWWGRRVAAAWDRAVRRSIDGLLAAL